MDNKRILKHYIKAPKDILSVDWHLKNLFIWIHINTICFLPKIELKASWKQLSKNLIQFVNFKSCIDIWIWNSRNFSTTLCVFLFSLHTILVCQGIPLASASFAEICGKTFACQRGHNRTWLYMYSKSGGNTSWGTFGNCTLGCLTWMHWHPGNIKCAAGHYLFTFSATVSLCHHSCWPAIFPADCCSFHWWNEFSPFRPTRKVSVNLHIRDSFARSLFG